MKHVVEWQEPHYLEIGARTINYNVTLQISVKDALLIQRSIIIGRYGRDRYAEDNISNKEILNDFIAIHWATVKEVSA